MLRRFIALILALLTAFCCLSGCDESEEVATVEGIEIRLLAVKNTAGVGLANLMEQSGSGQTVNRYSLTPFNLLSMEKMQMATSEWDIAVLPTNEASMFYRKKKGEIKVLATLSTGNYEILANDSAFNDVKQLKGKTVYFIERDSIALHSLKYILKNSGLSENDITVQYVSDIKNLSSKVGEKEAEYMVVTPAEAVEIKKSNAEIKSVNLASAWSKAVPNTAAPSYCVISTKSFVEQNTENIDVFLKELEQSVNKAAADVNGTAKLAVSHSLADSEAIAKSIIPAYKFTFASGKTMKNNLVAYYNLLRGLKSKGVLIGKTLPGEDFYYIPASTESK